MNYLVRDFKRMRRQERERMISLPFLIYPITTLPIPRIKEFMKKLCFQASMTSGNNANRKSFLCVQKELMAIFSIFFHIFYILIMC